MMLVYFIFLALISAYVVLIFSFIIGFDMLKTSTNTSYKSITFSIVIPFRNEAELLPKLLASITKLAYPKNAFEIIFVDDDSSDNSVKLIKHFCTKNPSIAIKIIQNKRSSNSPKKDAITNAIHHAKYNWILCTDADCTLPKKWLNAYASFIQTYAPNMVVAPVHFTSNNSFLEQFQMFDFLSMQGATMGSFGVQQPFMANGANLAYKKELFLQLNGFESNNFIASGDDVFLLETFLKHEKQKVFFLKNYTASVGTAPVKTWKALVQQRKRWAAKATHFNNIFTQLIGLLVFVANGISILALFLALYNSRFLWLIILKFVIDTVLIYKTGQFFKQKITNVHYLKTLLFYPFFTFYIAAISMFGSFQWKERAFKK